MAIQLGDGCCTIINVSLYSSNPALDDSQETERELRYTPFNVEALKKVTCQAAGAKRCVNFTKLAEGRPAVSLYPMQLK